MSSWDDVQTFDLPGSRGFTKSPVENFDRGDKRWLRRMRKRKRAEKMKSDIWEQW